MRPRKQGLAPFFHARLPLRHFASFEQVAALASKALPSESARTLREEILARQFSPDKTLGQVEYFF
jgi:hypothetical protein